MGVIEHGTGRATSSYVRSPLGAASNPGVDATGARPASWLVRVEPEVVAGVLVALWLALEVGSWWRRFLARWLG